MAREIWLADENGQRLISLDNNMGGYFGRINNGIGPCLLTLPGSFDWRQLRVDQQIHFWRSPPGVRLSLFRVYFVRYWNPRYVDGDLVVDIGGVDAVDLLKRRIVAAYNGSANATATAEESDDIMKRIVTDMESDIITPTPTEGTRAWDGFDVQPDLTIGPALDQAFAWQNVLDQLQDFAKASRAAGTEVFFTVDDLQASNTTIEFQFRTTTGQPGQDVSSRVVFDTENQTLKGASLAYDYRDEVNYVYGLGQGETTNQNIQQVADSVRYGASRWNRREGTAYAGGQETVNEVRDVARKSLSAGRPRRIFSGVPVDTPGQRFGVEWNWGDKVTAKSFGLEFPAIVRKAFVRILPDGTEAIDSRLEFEDS